MLTVLRSPILMALRPPMLTALRSPILMALRPPMLTALRSLKLAGAPTPKRGMGPFI
jgi:hypothetical protein